MSSETMSVMPEVMPVSAGASGPDFCRREVQADIMALRIEMDTLIFEMQRNSIVCTDSDEYSIRSTEISKKMLDTEKELNEKYEELETLLLRKV